VLDEPLVEQLRKLSAEDGKRRRCLDVDRQRRSGARVIRAARDRKQFVMISTWVEWLARDSVNPVGFCTSLESTTSLAA